MFKSAHISVVAELDTVDSLRLHACVCITVVTTHTIAIISTTHVIVNNVPVHVAGNDLEPPLTTISADPLILGLADIKLAHAVANAVNSVSVGAVV
jgi:hypothetical protein